MRITIELYADRKLVQTDELHVFPVLAKSHLHVIDISQAIQERVAHAVQHLLPPKAHRSKPTYQPHHHEPPTHQPPTPIDLRVELANHGILLQTITIHFTPNPNQPNIAQFDATDLIRRLCWQNRQYPIRDQLTP